MPMKLLKGARFTRPDPSTVVIQAMGRGIAGCGIARGLGMTGASG